MTSYWDLVCLVADKSMESVFKELLNRHQALGIRPICSEVIRHPGHDPGCFGLPEGLLAGYDKHAAHALVVLDRAWHGAPQELSAAAMEQDIERRLAQRFKPDWARAVVIDPELEAWVFTSSHHVATVLGWNQGTSHMRQALTQQGLWSAAHPKPHDPKRAMDWVLRQTGVARSSSLFRQLAQKVSLAECQDRAFQRLKSILQQWFP
ncbi:MAG: hypothetical protein RMM31_02675 [Anaerolineae bacterium]|nr:hypothetical protein [Thermoflexales bacterium]MDW8395127.1 hypothetical protein [Anaerolineae bacterium]